MSITTLARAKAHSSIYFDDRDDELEGKLDAAEEFVAKFLGRDDLSELVRGDSPARLLAIIEVLVLEVFDDFWQNKGVYVTGTIVTENPQWMRAAHLYRTGLGV
jgi:hypothetical protein